MDWKQRLDRAKISKKFTEEDRSFAALWISDPISEIAEKISLRNNDLSLGPTDIYLLLDGIFFTKGVEDNDINLACACYNSIYNRLTKLLHGKD